MNDSDTGRGLSLDFPCICCRQNPGNITVVVTVQQSVAAIITQRDMLAAGNIIVHKIDKVGSY